jgi:hypothetical protein
VQGALSRSSSPLVVVLQQVEDSCQPRRDAPIGLEGPRPIDDMEDHVGIGARSQVVSPLELSEALGRHVSLEDTWGDDLEPMVAAGTDPAAEEIGLVLDPWKIRRMGTKLEPARSTSQGRGDLLEPELT